MTQQKQELIDENPDSKKSPQNSATENEENKKGEGNESEENRNENKSISETFDEEFEAAEIERLFGPVDEKHHDVEQV